MSDFKTYSLNLHGRLVEITQPLVMGIVNATPDSFYDCSRAPDAEAIQVRVKEMIEQGADIVDIGACSTRPGAEVVSSSDEMKRLDVALAAARKAAPDAIISVDTFRADVARHCVEHLGADIINDISGGDLDTSMHSTVAQLQVPYIVMHMRGTPATMQQFTQYDGDVTVEQNYRLLECLDTFHSLGVPLLVGVSRKSMIQRVLDCSAQDALNGTTVINTIALMKGAHILRVHDVKAAVEARTLVSFTRNH